MALKTHYLGPNNMNHQANEAETKLKDSSNHSKRQHWNFEKYICMHQDQHTILQGLVEHGYAGIDKRSKVHHLLDGVKTNELDTAKGQIWASPRLQTHFDECVTLFQDFINNKKTGTSCMATIASLGTNASGTMKKLMVTFSPTCPSKIATTLGRSTASCPRQRNLV